MSQKIFCPKCNHQFDGENHLVLKISDLRSFFSVIQNRRSKPIHGGSHILDDSNLVECPNCGYKFSLSQYKFFGIFSLRTLKLLLLIFVMAFAIIPFCILFFDIYNKM